MTQDGPRPAPQRRVCRIDRGGGNPDPSRGGARDRPAGGRDDRGGLQDSVGGGGAPPARRRAGPRPDTRASSRHVRDRRRDRYRRAAHTLGTCAPEGPIPRGRSAERAPSTIHGHIRQNGQRLIRPAAASIRSRGPGGCCSRSSRLAQPRTPYLKPLCRRRTHHRTAGAFTPRRAEQSSCRSGLNVWVVRFWRATLGQFSRALKSVAACSDPFVESRTRMNSAIAPCEAMTLAGSG